MSPTPVRGSDSFASRATITVGARTLKVHRLDSLAGRYDIEHLPFCLKVLLENLLRHEDGVHVHAADVEAVASAAGVRKQAARSDSVPSGCSCRT